MEIKKLIKDEIGKLQKEIISYVCITPDSAIRQANQINLLENALQRLLIRIDKENKKVIKNDRTGNV